MASPKLLYKAFRKELSRSCAAFRFSRSTSSRAQFMTWGEVLGLWASRDAAFHQALTHELASCPFDDFFWECSPLSAATAHEPFEFVLISAKGTLNRASACADHFQEHFTGAYKQRQKTLIVSFLNLGRDALLIVPTPLSTRSASATKDSNMCGLSPPRAHILFWTLFVYDTIYTFSSGKQHTVDCALRSLELFDHLSDWRCS